MTRKIVDRPYTMDIHGNIKYPEAPKQDVPEVSAPHTDVSMDTLLLRGLSTIDRILTSCFKDASTGAPSRESVQNLKDCMTMLKDLKAQENDLLETMTDEQIEEYLSRTKK